MQSGIGKALEHPGLVCDQDFKTGDTYSVKTQEPPVTAETGIKHPHKHPELEHVQDSGILGGEKWVTGTGGRRS